MKVEASTRQAPLQNAVVHVWVILVLVTLLSWWLGTGHDLWSSAAPLLAFAFTKIWLIGLYFMDLRHAPRLLKGIFTLYCVAVPVVLVGVMAL